APDYGDLRVTVKNLPSKVYLEEPIHFTAHVLNTSLKQNIVPLKYTENQSTMSGPHRSVTSPAYGSAAAATSAAHHYQNTSVVLNDANCPYYQLYGPPPSYETVIAQTRGKVSTPSSPELLRGPSPRNTSSATAFVGPPCFYGLPPPSAAPHYQPLTCNQTPPPAFESAEYGYEPRPLSFGQRVHYVQCTTNAAAGKSSTENSDADNSIAHYGQDSPEEGGFSASSSSMLPRNDCASGSCAVLGTTLPCSYAPKWNTRIGVHGQHQLRDRTKIDSTISPQSLELMPDQPIATTSSNYGASTSSAMSHPPTRRKIQGGSLKMPRRREQQAKHYESVRVLAAANRRLSSASSSGGTGCTVPLGREVDQTYHQSSPSSNVITAENFDNERVTQQQQQSQQQQQQLTGHVQQPASSTNLNCEKISIFNVHKYNKCKTTSHDIAKRVRRHQGSEQKKKKYIMWNPHRQSNQIYYLEISLSCTRVSPSMVTKFKLSCRCGARGLSRRLRRQQLCRDTATTCLLSPFRLFSSSNCSLIGVLLGGEENSTRKKMQNIIDFETKIAEITTPQEERRDEEKMYNLMTLQELQEKAPFFSWLKYFQNATSLLNKTISNQMKVVVYAPDYLRKLTELVRDYKKTDEKKTILNDYLVWQTVRTLTSCLSKPFRDAYKGLRKALIGSEGHEEQWRFCVNDANNVMGFAIGAMFVREVFHGKSKPMAEEMINEIRSAFTKNLKNLDWMDAETRKSAEQKANAITDMIGFPDFILNPSEIDDGFKNLQINPNEYFMNNIRINVFTLKKNLEKLDQPVNKTSWIMTPPTVNAYYTPTKNQIVFPAGILQSPFFDMKNPSSLNFGGMGVVMGHELTHAFDDLGREYDLNGNLHQWWNNATIDRFKNRTECFVDQYHNYEIEGRRVNGRQTLGENIADNGGLKAAYHAYLAKHKNMDDLLSLPGLDLSHEQLFFVNFAQVWCSAATTEAVSLQIEKDSHCPAKYRVIGPLSNLEEFSREFNCPKGSRMNPIHKCEVW
ncbi:unnamed protein product, partial [Trichogramma brassicae]